MDGISVPTGSELYLDYFFYKYGDKRTYEPPFGKWLP